MGWIDLHIGHLEENMNKLHTTKSGETLMIAQMDDSHLTNHIKLLLRHIEQAKGALGANMKVSKFQSAMYGVNQESLEKKAAKKIKGIADQLYPYLAEAMLRGINFTTELQKIFERTGKEERITVELDLLEEGHKSRYISYEEDNPW